MIKSFSKTRCAKCDKPIDKTDRHSYLSLGESIYGIKNAPLICTKTCFGSWSKYFMKYVVLKFAKCTKEEKNKFWKHHFEKWLKGKWGIKPEKVIFT